VSQRKTSDRPQRGNARLAPGSHASIRQRDPLRSWKRRKRSVLRLALRPLQGCRLFFLVYALWCAPV